MITKNTLAAAIAATVTFGAMTVPAFAAPAMDDPNVNVAVVRTADLNLASEEGLTTLKARISGAVSRVCGTASGTTPLEERLAINTCRAKARRAALAAAVSQQAPVLAQR
ncbi:UrcA family protein [Novosphingobium sp.]|uniref:UrcA family protein n=1 Tax=Novosphingobium sp. TaxID=1874826 RepID=UPI0026033FE1|nr:UrcA family protein [Novosphingobium sp.]